MHGPHIRPGEMDVNPAAPYLHPCCCESEGRGLGSPVQLSAAPPPAPHPHRGFLGSLALVSTCPSPPGYVTFSENTLPKNKSKPDLGLPSLPSRDGGLKKALNWVRKVGTWPCAGPGTDGGALGRGQGAAAAT